MPEKKTIRRARKDKREGKSAGTQAGEFVRETIDHIREGKHGARSAKQAIAIGLSKARRAGVKIPIPAKGKGLREDTQASHPRDQQSEERRRFQTIAQAHTRFRSRIEERGSGRGFLEIIIAALPCFRFQTKRGGALCGSSESCAHQGCKRTLRRCTQGRAYSG